MLSYLSLGRFTDAEVYPFLGLGYRAFSLPLPLEINLTTA